MYWGNHWDKEVGYRRTALGEKTGKAEAKAEKLLEAIIDGTGEPTSKRKIRRVYAVFPTPAFESRFKSCLSRVPVDCKTEEEGGKRIVAVRPRNIAYFDELVRTSGLANCDAATKAVHFLRTNPGEFLRFETR